MATYFTLKEDGVIFMRVRMGKRIDGVIREVVNIKKNITGLYAPEELWRKYESYTSSTNQKNFLSHNSDFSKTIDILDDIRKAIDFCGTDITIDKVNEIVRDYVYADLIAKQKEIEKDAEEKKQAKAEAERRKKQMTLTKFIDQYIKDIKEEKRTTLQYGRSYSRGSKFNTANALGHFKEFMEDTGIVYDFQDVDLDCYSKYKTWLMNRDISTVKFKDTERNYKNSRKIPKGEQLHYSDNTIGRFIKQLKAVLRAAESRGYPVNPAYKSIEFKGQVQDIDAIYLTKAELEAMEAVKLSKEEDGKNLELARDIFMIGVWLAQRVSDYNNLKPENIKVIDNGGTQITYVSIHQQKTGRLVEIPCNAKIRAILDKYPKGLPHLSDEKINTYIKRIGRMAKINELIEVKESRGGKVYKNYYKKCDLICTHTARRTGATLMYLDGIPIYDIMKVTGHRSVATLEKYIRADKLEVAQKLVLKYDYFK